MNKDHLIRIAAALVFIVTFCMTPVLAADPALAGTVSGKIGTSDGLTTAKWSAISDAKSTAGFDKTAVMSTFSHPSRKEMDLASLKDAPVEWDPAFMYYARRWAASIPSCRLG